MFSTGVCRWLFLVISLSTWKIVLSSKEMRVVCYYTNWSVYRPGAAKFSPQNINPYMCTHLIYAFGGFTKENTLKPFDKYQDIEKGGYAKFTGLKTYNKDLKTMLAIGGWNEGSSRFSPMVANPDRRKEFVKNAIKFLRLNHFDGLDLDWEYPSFRDGGKPRDRDNYAQLVQELREEFDRESSKTGRTRLLLTMAVPAGIEYINKGYDVPKLTKYLDWMNILSYDYHSAFEPAVNHHAPLYSLEEDNEYNYEGDLNIDHTIKHYLELGAEPNKLVLGIPTYGRSYTLFNPDAFEIGSPADGPGEMGEATRENGYLAYYEICDYVKNQEWEVDQPNSKAMGPYAFKDNQWVGYDDEDIVRRKAEYVAENDLGGIMFWAIDNDDFRGDCHGKAYPLIEAGREALLKAYGLTEDNQIVPSSKPQKSRRKRPNKSTNKINPSEETHVKIEKTTINRRRNRIKPVEKEQPKNETKSRRKLRRKDSSTNDEEPTSYSSLKVVTPSYTTPSPPSTPDMGGAFKCEDEGFFQHPKDCKKYFWCLSGAGDSGIVAHAFTCPAGLFFNKAADSCDYSQNVLCNKKMQKSSTTTKKEEPSTTSTTAATIISSTRIPPKITAATSRTTFKQTTTTTEAYEDDYEYDDEEEDNKNTKTETEEEDPRVIKELIDLIKKAGGIEELEKQLRFSNEGAESSESSKFTTQSSISKSLYEKVISKAIKNTADTRKLYSSIQNSRGSQTDGLTTRREKSPSQPGTSRGKLSYTSISRSRPANTKSAENKEDTETENISEKTQSRSSAGKTNSVEYVNIRRPRVSTTTSEPENNSVFSRNKYLGETDEDEDESEYDDEEDEENDSINTPKKQTYTPQYVNIRRQRPSTTEEPTSSKYSEIRRGSTAPSSEQPEEERDEPSTTSKYKFLRRGTTSTISPPSSVTDDSQSSRLQTTPASLSQPADELSSKRYIQLTRGTTTERSSIEADKTIMGLEQALTSTDVFSANDSQHNVNNASDTTKQLSSNDNNILIETETNKIVDTTTTSTTSNGGDSLSTKKIPVFDAKSTSTPVTESSILTAKVSQPNFRYRSRSKIDNQQYSENVPSRQTIVRNASRFRPETSEKETKEINDRLPVPQKRRIISTTEKYVEDNRTYRPTELADLSSLTAVDFSKIKEFNIGQSSNRRRRPVIPSSTTTSTEGPEGFSSVKTRTRKLTDQSTFAKSRRLVKGRENQTQLVSESTKKYRRVTFGTTEEPSASRSNPENTESSTTSRNRKIIRRFRPGSRNPINFNEGQTKNVNENILVSRQNFVNEPSNNYSSLTDTQQQTRSFNENNIEGENEDSFEDTNIDDEEENIKLSESNIRENSALNSFGSDPKFERKTFKSENLYQKSTIPEQPITTERYGTDIEVNKTREPSMRIRTRKIIRKITPTPAPPNQIDPDLNSRKRKIIRKLRPVTVANIASEMLEDAENDNDDDSFISTDSPGPEIDSNINSNQSNRTEYVPENSEETIDLVGLPEDESSIGLEKTSENYETTTTEKVVPKYVNKLFKLRPNESRKRFKNAQENISSSTEKTTSSSPKYKSYSRRPNYSNRRFTSTEKIGIDEKDEADIDGEKHITNDNDNNGISRGSARYNSIEPLPTTLSHDFVTRRYNSLRRPSNKNTTSQILQHSTEIFTDDTNESITTEFVNENITITTTESSSTEFEELNETQMSTTEFATVQPDTTYDDEIITNSIETTKYDGVIQDVDLSTTSELPSETYVTIDSDSINTIVTDESTDSTLNNISTELTTESSSSTTEKSTTNEITNTVPAVLTSHRTSTLRSINLRPKYVPAKLKDLSLNQPTESSNIFKPTRFYGRTRTPFKSITEPSKVSEDDLASEISSTTERSKNKFGKFKNGFRSGFSTKQNQLQSTSTTTVRPKNTYLYRYSTTKKSVEDVEEDDNVEYDEETNDEDSDKEENFGNDEPNINGNNLNQQQSTRKPLNRFTNKPTFSRTTEKEPNAEETLKNINTEAVRNRNKNLFSKKRIMNIPVSGSPKTETQPTDEDSINSITTVPSTTTSSSTESSTDSPTTEFVKSSDQQETTEYLTTLHHIFAQIAGDTEMTTKQTTSSENSADKIERLIEVSRIVNVKTKEEKVKHNHHVEQTTDEVSSILDKIGAINRVTSIKVVDVDGMTKHESENVNALSPIFIHSNASEYTTSESPIKSSVDMIIQIAKVQEVPPPNAQQKVNLTNINVQIDASGIPDQLFSHREDRKIDIFGGSKISNSKTNDIDLQKAEIIDGRSHINIVTPRPIYNTEASTISLEGLFRADESLLFNRNSALNDELLETENSKFVNVRVLHPDESVRINKELRKDDKVIPIKILKQDEDDVATKARVVEILPKTRLDTIKIVPIRVEMSRSIAHNLPLIDLNRTKTST